MAIHNFMKLKLETETTTELRDTDRFMSVFPLKQEFNLSKFAKFDLNDQGIKTRLKTSLISEAFYSIY